MEILVSSRYTIKSGRGGAPSCAHLAKPQPLAAWWRFQPGHHPAALPKFDGVFADKPFGGFDCLGVVGAVEISTCLDATVRPYLISAVMRHVRFPTQTCDSSTMVPLRSLGSKNVAAVALANVHKCTQRKAPLLRCQKRGCAQRRRRWYEQRPALMTAPI